MRKIFNLFIGNKSIWINLLLIDLFSNQQLQKISRKQNYPIQNSLIKQHTL